MTYENGNSITEPLTSPDADAVQPTSWITDVGAAFKWVNVPHSPESIAEAIRLQQEQEARDSNRFNAAHEQGVYNG